MKLLLENWRQYIKQEVENFLPHGTVQSVDVIGSSTLSPEEQEQQDMEKHGYVQTERDIDVEVQIAGITPEESEEWAFSEEAQRLEDENNYDVQLRIVENWRKLLSEKKNPRIPRKKGQPAKSKKHSDLYTDEDPKGTIHGLGYKDEATARASVAKIRKSNRSHAHKTQAAIAMEQRAKAAGKSKEAAIFRKFIEQQKKKTKAKKNKK